MEETFAQRNQLRRRDLLRIFGSSALLLLSSDMITGCGGGGTTSIPINSSNPFANTYSGILALRTADNQLSGDLAAVNLTMAVNNQITGTVVLQPDTGTDAALKPLSRANPNGTITITGIADAQTGVFTATGSGSDVDGSPVSLTVQGTPQQLSTSQLVLASLTVSGTTTTKGKGMLKGSAQAALPSNVSLPPIITGTLKIPQGVTVRFAATGSDQPANPDQTETGDVVNFSLPNYHSPGFDGYSNIDSGEWAFSYDGTYFTLSVPLDAPITTGYEIRDRSTGTQHSASFEVIASPLQQYTGSNFTGGAVWADVDFFSSLDLINAAAGAAGVKVLITNSFRAAGQTLQGTVVPPASMSNHLVGHAIDMNVQYTDTNNKTQNCNSTCLAQATPPAAVTDFISRVKAAGLRYGGDFTPTDVVHFDDGYNANKDQWLQKYGIIQQCAKNQGFAP